MTFMDALYNRFGVGPTCTDGDLRKAFVDLIRQTHPDINQQDPEATRKAQDLIQAYAALKDYRERGSSDPIRVYSDNYAEKYNRDIRDIVAIRKTQFREMWKDLQDYPFDPMRALRFIHAAFEAERALSDFLTNLLLDPILIDLASMLLSDAESQGMARADGRAPVSGAMPSAREARSVTLARWADFLWNAGRGSEAIQILEDAFGSGLASPGLTDELRSLHYRSAQYPDPTTDAKSAPEVRIAHLKRIIELGYNLDYIHKLLAEAYHDLGDDEHARAYLKQAYEMNPNLTGAVRITRVLGFPPIRKAAQPQTAAAKKPKWTPPMQVPTPTQIRTWAENQQWGFILDFSDPGGYSRSVLPKARDTLRAIAVSLAWCNDPAAIRPLMTLLRFNYYWDVAQAAATSLSKIGDEHTLAALNEFSRGVDDGAHYWNSTTMLKNCISYLRARVDNALASVSNDASSLLRRAKLEAGIGDYGLARFLLENLLLGMKQDHPQFLEATVLRARSCANMGDIEAAVEIIRPGFATLQKIGDRNTITHVGHWLSAKAGMEEYNETLDGIYEWALELNLFLISIAMMPDEVLSPLRELTRWLERLGAGGTANMIRELIRIEAPGTGYVDKHDRANYVRHVTLSGDMHRFLEAFNTRIKAEAVTKLKDVMRSEHWLEAQR